MEARTGRISSTGSRIRSDVRYQNLQNVPKQLRSIYIPDEGVFTDADFSQIELRVLAYFSGDHKMDWAFETGDIHLATAEFMGIDRYYAKTVNFSMVYGATDETIAENANTDIVYAAELRRNWFRQYPRAAKYIEDCQAQAMKDGFITTLYGRKIPLDMNEPADKIKRKAINYPIQASAAEVVKKAMLRIGKAGLILTRDLSGMLLQVHDEFLLNNDRAKEMITLDLDHIAPFVTPLNIKLVERWE